jgi:hypothetical protein
VNLDKKLMTLLSGIEGGRFPGAFTLEEQASFALGYYHQRQRDFASAAEKKEV